MKRLAILVAAIAALSACERERPQLSPEQQIIGYRECSRPIPAKVWACVPIADGMPTRIGVLQPRYTFTDAQFRECDVVVADYGSLSWPARGPRDCVIDDLLTGPVWVFWYETQSRSPFGSDIETFRNGIPAYELEPFERAFRELQLLTSEGTGESTG